MQQVLQPSPQIDRMWTPYKSKSTITPILSNTSMHTPAPSLSGYNNTTDDMGVVNSWLTPGTPFVPHEYPSALFTTDSDARFVSRRKTRKFRNPSPIYSSDSSSSQSEIVPSRIKVMNAPRNQPRRSSVATVQPAFDGMRASMSPMTPNNNYMQF